MRLTYDGQAGSVIDKVFNPNFLDLWHGKITAEQARAALEPLPDLPGQLPLPTA